MRVTVSIDTAPLPGDIRHLGTGDTVELHQSARGRYDWSGILCALPNAIARGASIVWEEE